jgi:hypothetical protein
MAIMMVHILDDPCSARSCAVSTLGKREKLKQKESQNASEIYRNNGANGIRRRILAGMKAWQQGPSNRFTFIPVLATWDSNTIKTPPPEESL